MGNQDVKEIDLKDWVIVNSPGGRFLGRISDPNAENISAQELRRKVVEMMDENKTICLSPAFDFIMPLTPMQMPGGGVSYGRNPLVLPVDLSCDDSFVVWVKPATVYFLGDLKEVDIPLYKSLIAAAKEAALQQRAANSGLAMPGGPKPRG